MAENDEFEDDFEQDFTFDDNEDHENLFDEDTVDVSADGDEFNFDSGDLNFEESESDEDEDENDEGTSRKSSNPIEDIMEKIQQGDIKGLLVPAAIGAVILTIVIFFFTSFFGSGNEATTITTKKENLVTGETDELSMTLPPADKTTVSNPQQPVQPTTQVTVNQQPAQPPVVQTTANNEQGAEQAFREYVKQRILQIDSDSKQLNDKVNAISQQAIQNQDQLSSINQSISNIQTQVMKLNNALVNLLNAVQTAPVAQVERPVVVQTDQPVADIASYYVQAVIPGRAWLKNSQGKIFTVGLGDEVPGLGAVQVIDAKNGAVVTSSGARIEYGIEQY